MKNKNKHNRKGKSVVTVDLDNTEVSKIKIDLDLKGEKYDECNQLILPSKKRPTKTRKDEIKPRKILSKAQKKKLEKIVDKKKKKANRSSLLEALQKVQAPAEELEKLTSLAAVQTKGLKRHFAESNFHDGSVDSIKQSSEAEINSIKGSKKRRKLLEAAAKKNWKPTECNPNVVGFDSESSSDENSDTEETCNAEESNVPIISEVKEEEVTVSPNTVVKSYDHPEKITQIAKTIKKEPADNYECHPAVFIPVDRDPKVQAERLKLPITAEEQVIMEAISENDVVIIAGETGSGKTTQVPQFLYEAGYSSKGKIIGITQPRRVAAISMSKRVAQEMNLGSDVISYLIRFEGNTTENTKIKFMTDGVLLKEIQTDFTLSKYSVILLDEAHERNIYTDILIGLLSRIVPLRKKRNDLLKLIIMSATLRVEDFTENTRLFKIPPPLIKVDTRQFPVTTYFSKRTADNYITACFLKTCKIHTSLPEGGILVFVTGQAEVNHLVKKLRKTFPYKHNNETLGAENNLKQVLQKSKSLRKNMNIVSNIEINLDKYSVVPNDDTEMEILEESNDLDEIDDDFDDSVEFMKGTTQEPLWVLPMYSLLPSSEQSKVFDKPPEGCRLCVVSTNVAETSLTIPNIKYVVDSGKTKTKLFDKTTGVTKFEITWCSKASANQRAGRAGRVGPGYCYRLYSSAVFNDEFPEFSIPEIQQKPIDDLILQMKAMNIVRVFNFPFPTAPDLLQLKSGELRLKILGALEESSDEWSSKLSKLGETMSTFPVAPRFAKMLALSYQHNLLQYTTCIVAALSVTEVLLNNDGDSKWSQLHGNWAGTGDVMVLLRAVGAAEYSKENLEEFCLKNGLRHRAICEIRKLRVQLTNQINLNIPGLNLIVDPMLKPPTDMEAKLLRQILLSGLTDHVAQKVNLTEINDEEEKRKWKRAYRSSEMETPIFLHSGSVLKGEMLEWVAYQEVYETNKLYMRGRAALTLPTMEIPLTHGLMSYKLFAKFFLEGEIFPKLKKYVGNLLSSPSVMAKTWARLQPRTQILLSALVVKKVNTRDQAMNIWKEDPMYLLDAYKSWLPESAHESILIIWPPVG
ncbi:hypothetical protein RUM44_012372 [Polyplax serrata]|uniref:ATP-dependent RNA helicase DHX37 n=1 Tax=Polyplax serrata TaxID=468196 RepID=A0ABR1BD85_POLSC